MTLNKLNIAMLSVHSCPFGNLGARDTGGMSVYIRELARQLGKQGHSVDVYTRIHDPEDPLIVDLGLNARLIHLKAGQDADMHKLALYSYLPEFTCNLEKFRKNAGLKYDVVFSHYWLSGWVGQYLQRWWQAPHITMFHTLGAIKNAIGIGEDEPELRIVSERETMRDCHQIIATTEKEKEELVRLYSASTDKICVIPCGVNTKLFQPVDKKEARKRLGLTDDKIILFVGRIDTLKGVDQLLKASAYLQKIKGHRLLIIGGDEYSQNEVKKLRELARELDIQDSVTFQGLVKHEELPYYYSASDVCAVPSYYESFGLVALESLACGTPVVANDVGDLRNIIHPAETGYVVSDNSPKFFADKIAQLISRPSDSKSALSIRVSVERFSWPNIAESVVMVLQSLLVNQFASVS